MSVLDAQREVANLPEGHYAIKEAQERVAREYKAAHEYEREALQRIFGKKRLRKGKHIFDLATSRKILEYLCHSLGCLRIPKLVFDDLPYNVAGQYNHATRTIQVQRWRANDVPVNLLIHEFSHYLDLEDGGWGGHGPAFVEYETLAFTVLGEWWEQRRKEESIIF